VPFDVRTLDPLTRFHLAEAARTSHDITDFPVLGCWNYLPCRKHQEIDPLCKHCGVILRRHQRVGAAWLYSAGKGLLADSVGLGKTAQVAAVLAWGRDTGELGAHARTVIICKPAAMGQWRDELRRMIPQLYVITTADLTPTERTRMYLSRNWECLLITPQTLAPSRGEQRSRAGDILQVEQFPLGLVVYDDTDGMRTLTNRQANAVCRLSACAPRVIGVHGTSLQKKLKELYSFLMPIGAQMVFGTERQFTHRYVSQSKTFYQGTDRTGRQVLKYRISDTGLQHEEELRSLLAPMVLRRRASDVDDISMPAIVPGVIWLDPTPAQWRSYEELRQHILLKLNTEGDTISRMEARALWIQGWQICSGLATHGHDSSVKLDWVMDAATGDLSDEKIVVFVNFKPNVQALSDRMNAAGIGNVIMWGDESSHRVRDARLAAFRDDPACRVLIGTTTIEASLNLQVARHLIAVDTISNPGRMAQLVGRVARAGSVYQTVYFHQLLLRGIAQEENIPAQLHSEQDLADTVWNEQGDLFQAVSPQDLLRMMVGRGRAA
jgi:SNF2 family DNA or RNA helicase